MATKESWLEGSKELKFGNPPKPPQYKPEDLKAAKAKPSTKKKQ